MFDLTGKQAAVTGGSRGIGQAIAIALASAGADVASLHLPDPDNARKTERKIREHGRAVLMVEGDAANQAEVEAFADQVEEACGKIDIWINNAAQLLIRPLLEMSTEEWRHIMSVNLDGYYYGCCAAARRMVPHGFGRIINVSSVTARQPAANLTAYVTAKGGVLGLTRSLAVELAPLGITVNAVAPGAIVTPLNRDAYTAEVMAAYESRIALGRLGAPNDVAGAAVFLASAEARYVTGHELLVDGGLALNGNVGLA